MKRVKAYAAGTGAFAIGCGVVALVASFTVGLSTAGTVAALVAVIGGVVLLVIAWELP